MKKEQEFVVKKLSEWGYSTARCMARFMHDKTKDPSPNQVEAMRVRLERMASKGTLQKEVVGPSEDTGPIKTVIYGLTHEN